MNAITRTIKMKEVKVIILSADEKDVTTCTIQVPDSIKGKEYNDYLKRACTTGETIVKYYETGNVHTYTMSMSIEKFIENATALKND